MKNDEMHSRSRVTLFILLGAFLLLSLAFNIYFTVGLRTVSLISLSAARNVAGLDFTVEELRMLESDVEETRAAYEAMREIEVPNSTAPSFVFNPLPPGFEIRDRKAAFKLPKTGKVKRPENLEETAFWPVPMLAELIRTRQVSSVELTRMYLNRLKTYGDSLHCVITLTEDRAMRMARAADEAIARGQYKGLLHGLPYGAKDLLAVDGYPTTWGATPYQNQTIDDDATVIEKLDAAGAVLVAKLSMGALAWGDVWFGGTTRNPWNKNEGSSGSSAGSASATSAGLVAFSIGTETWGSIVSPSTRCRVSGLRPTFGRVSRNGAMALSWSMDKIGPICRSVDGCAAVFNAIHGEDGLDMSQRDVPFAYAPQKALAHLRIGYLKADMDEDSSNAALYHEALEAIRGAGGSPEPMAWPDVPVYDLSFVLNAEAAAAFDELTRSGKDDELVRQVRNAWPNVFRQARFIPAVEYIQAMRIRTQLMAQVAELMKRYDVVIAPSFGGSTLLLTNLTGHPAVVVPAGVDADGHSRSLSFVGQLYEDGKTLEVARAFQNATGYHQAHPDLAPFRKQ